MDTEQKKPWLMFNTSELPDLELERATYLDKIKQRPSGDLRWNSLLKKDGLIKLLQGAL